MPKVSAGLLVYRRAGRHLELLLAHLGGPYWGHRDLWSIPKGIVEPDEDLVDAARREYEEELGLPPPPGELLPLGTVTQRGGKVVHAWAIEGDLDPDDIRPGTFTMEWPPRSGRTAEFPEIDRVGWFDPRTARRKLNASQARFVDRLQRALA